MLCYEAEPSSRVSAVEALAHRWILTEPCPLAIPPRAIPPDPGLLIPPDPAIRIPTNSGITAPLDSSMIVPSDPGLAIPPDAELVRGSGIRIPSHPGHVAIAGAHSEPAASDGADSLWADGLAPPAVAHEEGIYSYHLHRLRRTGRA